MKVNEYIYRNWANWNFAILKQLCEDEGIEWSDALESYLKTTPTNTNWSLLRDFGIEPYGSDEGGSDKGEVWFTGMFSGCEGSNVSAQLTETDKANLDDILANYEDYSVSLNGTELPVATGESTAVSKQAVFTDADETVGISLDKDDKGVTNNFAFAKCPTDITNVEVTVTHK